MRIKTSNLTHIKNINERRMKMVRSITASQATIVMILSMGLMNHVIVLPSVLTAAGRDSWVSLLGVGILFILWVPLIYWIIKKTNRQHLISWLKTNSHPAAAWLVKLILAFLLVLNLYITLYTTFSWVNSTYMIQTPRFVLFFPFILLCLYAAVSGIKTIAIAGGVVLPLVVLLGFFIMFSNMHYKDYSLLLPVFENGITPVMAGAVILGGGLVEFFYFAIIQQHIRTEVKLFRLFLLSIFILLINLGPIIGAITEFGPKQASNISNPAYAQWRLLTIGKYLNRLDFLSVYQWLSGAFVRISLSLFMFAELFHPKTKKKHNIILIILTAVLILLLCIPVDSPAMKQMIDHYYFSISVIGILFVTFFITIIIFFRGRVKKNEAPIEQSR
ncbi:spore gernimation protein [Cytobacillus horneckiae]|uniref:Spore gernimation protein n=2 Tax=Cytobacillus horneckiae TaxID=549687 RepID=A0A2N0ZEM0_9BACI|nr:spore gernimation protein [Cytobacillus horneckiae]